MDYSVCMSSTGEEKNSTSQVIQVQQCYCCMTADEEDLIRRLHNLLGDRWSLIAGRIPGRTAEEVEKYWKLKTESQHMCSSHKKEILKPVCSRLQPSIESTPSWFRIKSGFVKYHLLAKH
ncbi:hypothetical protein SUGI_0288070 [Cryptomeria japonica]|uniref:MYB-like transcription factor TCL2 n=1 Tax=Cryptomeria japonica TaxID=3369 RepID=UPI002408B193|nr:MYB-like transcription factor TCL2 [Cryptomeria japonica]GLJ16741.1 hypothetical protein SUGI_0288070 [Cryptomeria japonica]